jgi:hypothetical protein
MPYEDGTKTLDELIAEIPNADALIQRWKELVYDRSSEVDTASEMDWHSLGVGFWIGIGLSPAHANAMSTYVRYRTEWG